MEDPFNIGFKAFFGVATGIAILILTFNFIQSIGSGIEEYIDNQERKERAIIREKEKKKRENLLEFRRKRELEKKIERRKYLEDFSKDALEDFR
tara:strand:+ start:243 stop:524 length:282 start_codon:yes stop_codon:yes gene_type:complete